jgi:hypothetical protein
MEAEAVARFRRRAAAERKCRYMLMGLISSKLCPNYYECRSCSFDQAMEFRFGIHPVFVASAAKRESPTNPGETERKKQ